MYTLTITVKMTCSARPSRRTVHTPATTQNVMQLALRKGLGVPTQNVMQLALRQGLGVTLTQNVMQLALRQGLGVT